MNLKLATILLAAAAALAPVSANATVRITEVMFEPLPNGAKGEYVELTNLDTVNAADVTGWAYDDGTSATRAGGATLFSGLGLSSIGAGESIILTEIGADLFRTYWGLDASVRVFSYGGDNNLNGSDQANIYDATGARVDYVSLSGTQRGRAANRPYGGDGHDGAAFDASAVGDVYNSHGATGAISQSIGNPGYYLAPAAVPEPATWALMISGFGLVGVSLRRRRAAALA